MNTTTTTETHAMKRTRLEHARHKWKAVVDQLYCKLHITPGDTTSLAIRNHRINNAFEETMIRQIHQGELQLENFRKLLEEITIEEEVKEPQRLS